MVDNIDILQDRECCDFGRHSSEEPDVFFSVVSLDVELFIKPRKECLNSFPSLSERLVEWPLFFLYGTSSFICAIITIPLAHYNSKSSVISFRFSSGPIVNLRYFKS